MKIDISDELAELLRKFEANEPPFKTDHDRLVELREQLHRSRVAGANKTNAMQSRAAADFRKPWLARYRALRADGLCRKRAIDKVDDEMIAAGKMMSRAWLYKTLTDS